MVIFYLWIIISSISVQIVKCWDHEELEIFDLVEEIGVDISFYKILNVKQSANLTEIKRAFRNLSILLHPDKNKAEEANVQFRNLVSVYDVLKDVSKRGKYDKVLQDGLPNWKSALFYYRRMRKMSIAEAIVIFFIFLTIAQYLFAWAAYIEKKYTAEKLFSNRLRKLNKKNKKNTEIEAIINEIPTPSVIDTLPFQLPIGLYNLLINGPKNMQNILNNFVEQRKRIVQRNLEKQMELERLEKLEQERAKIREETKLRKRRAAQNVPQKSNEEMTLYSSSVVKNGVMDDNASQRTYKCLTNRLWVDDDIVELVRLVKKYPGGTPNRWEVIAEIMNRSIYDITHMAAKLKDTGFKVPGKCDSSTECYETVKNKIKTRRLISDSISENVWTQEQQKALEAAIIKYPKSIVGDRWQKISSSVHGKTREECLLRYKCLVELVRKQKRDEIIDTTETDENKTDSKNEENLSKSSNQTENFLAGKYVKTRKVNKKNFEISYEDYNDST